MEEGPGNDGAGGADESRISGEGVGSEQVSDCAENMAIASRAFFRDFSTVRDYSQKVYFIEHESDLTSGRMLEAIFDSELPLANKLQLDSLITEVADIADIAEDCVDELLIFTIKRDI